MVHHITKARWVVAVRRIPEALLWSFPLLALLSIPILIGMHDLYHWTHAEVYVEDSPEYDAGACGQARVPEHPVLPRTSGALLSGCGATWPTGSTALSLRQDVDPDPEIPAQQRKVSGWGIPVFAVTVAFASYDLIMSLDPHWFSTIFGVYIFAGAFSSSIALVVLASALLQRRAGALRQVVTV